MNNLDKIQDIIKKSKEEEEKFKAKAKEYEKFTTEDMIHKKVAAQEVRVLAQKLMRQSITGIILGVLSMLVGSAGEGNIYDWLRIAVLVVVIFTFGKTFISERSHKTRLEQEYLL